MAPAVNLMFTFFSRCTTWFYSMDLALQYHQQNTHTRVVLMSAQLSLLPSVGREISTGQRAVMHCAAGESRLIPFVDARGGDGR